MALIKKLLVLLALLAMLLATGCYHMRLVPEPIAPQVFQIKTSPSQVRQLVKQVLEDTRQLRILEGSADGAVMITAPWHFATDTGFGQPAGGRKYYTQLQIETVAVPGATQVTLSPYHYEIRTTYAYGAEGGQVQTLNKHYPYETYPGMFDNTLLVQELSRLADSIQRSMQ